MAAPASNTFQCPRCGKRFKYASLKEHKPFPFCTERCRDIDLGNWMMEKYVISGDKPDSKSAANADSEDSDDEISDAT